MPDGLPKDFCPYKGLQPYTEADRAFFFGRERDAEIIASNLYASPLTVLYGESGVGKSSVLLAGVVPLLRQTPNVAVVVFRQWQDARFAQMLRTEILGAVSEAAGKETSVDLSLPLDEFLIACNRILRGPIFFLFDQFEEFFLYHAASESAESFDAEWARSVNRQEVDANFLISLREDSLSRLDRFRGRMPQLMGNMLRLKHLDEAAGRTAIRKPLEKYNELLPDGQTRMEIEDALVETLLKEIQAGRVTLGATGGQVNTQDGAEKGTERIETPFLQMVLTRLWDEERTEGSHVLRRETLNRLGGAERIIRTHLDKVMDKLSETERDVAAQLFRFLVTPSGSKIAHTTNDLISYAEMPSESVGPVLELLGSPDVRILRPIAPPPGQQDGVRYEIFHDVLAQAVLDWRTRYMQEQRRLAAERELEEERKHAAEKLLEEKRRTRRSVWIAGGLFFILLITAGLLLLVLKQSRDIRRAQVDSHSRELAAYALDNSDYDPDLSLLLAIEAGRVSMTTHAVEALKKSLASQWTEKLLEGHAAPVLYAVFSPDGKYVATASADQTARVWDVATGRSVAQLSEHRGGVTSVAFTPDGRYLMTAAEDRKVFMWENWQADARVIATLDVPFLTGAALSPDGRYIAVSNDNSVSVWEWKTEAGPKKLRTMSDPIGLFIGLTFSPDGKYVAVLAPSEIVMWEWEATEARDKALELRHEGNASKVAFTSDGKFVAARCGGSMICIWDWLSGPLARNVPIRLSKSSMGVRGVAFSMDGGLLVTGQENGTVLVWKWRAETNKEKQSPQEIIARSGDNVVIYSLSYSPDGRFLVTASEDKTARIMRTQNLSPEELNRMTPAELLRLAESHRVRDFTKQERQRYLEEPSQP